MPTKLSVRDLDCSDRRVFCRVDFNVPLGGGAVSDDRRIVASLPTIRLLVERGARTVLASHLGRPKGKPRPEMSLRPVAAHLGTLLGTDVVFAEDCIGDEVERASRALPPGGVLVVENLRFHPEEEANEAGFSEALSRLGDVYVNDAFGSAHRAHASTVGVPSRLKPAAAGLLMQAELDHLGGLLERPRKPFLAILGGAKVSDKIELIENLLGTVDAFLIGGAMAYTFLAAQGVPIGRSLLEADKVSLARDLLSRGVEILLPVDHVVAVVGETSGRTTSGVEIAGEDAGFDIGPRTAQRFASRIASARTVLWNGPLGRFEVPAFAGGSRLVAQAIADSSAVSIVGGGDTAAAVEAFGLADRMTHVSTGGGASLEFLSGQELPGVAALDDAR